MADCPNGLLDRETLEEMYRSFLPEKNSVNFVDQLFRVFDIDSSGGIDFKVAYSIPLFWHFRLVFTGVPASNRHDYQWHL